MASQLNDPSITFKAWGWSENCTLLLDLLINRSISEEVFLGACKPNAEVDAKVIILTVILSLLLLGTAGGNMLVIIAILIVKKLRSPTNLLIVNLAVTDFLVSILVLPFAIAYQILGYWPFNQVICDLYSISDVLLCTLSILSLCTISIDRYLVITKPLRYATKRTPRRMFLMILISWLLSAAISIPPVYGWEQKNSPFYCGYSEELTYQIYATMTAFYIPLAVMLVLYGKILVLAKQMACVDAQAGRKGSIDTHTRTSSNPEFTEWHRCSLYASGGENHTTAPLYPDLKTDWEAGGCHSKPRQSVVSFKPSPTVIRSTERRPVRRGKIHSLLIFSRRSNPEIVNNGSSSEASGSIGNKSMCGYGKSPLFLLRRHRRHTHTEQGKGETHKAVTTLGVIMGCFTICWLPFFVSQLITPIINCFTKERFAIPPTLFQVFIWLGYGNSFLNPLIYALFNREFRLPFLYILRLQCSDINTRLRTENFSHEFGLPRKSCSGVGNSLTIRGTANGSNGRRQRRHKPRGLSPLLTNSHAYTSPSLTSHVSEAQNVPVEESAHSSSPLDEEKTDEAVKTSPVQSCNNCLAPCPVFMSLQVATASAEEAQEVEAEAEAEGEGEEDDLLANNPPRPSRLMSRRESLLSLRSNYDMYIPNLNAEFQRSPLLTPSSAPPCLNAPRNEFKLWTRAREFRPNQVATERLARQTDFGLCPGDDETESTQEMSVL